MVESGVLLLVQYLHLSFAASLFVEVVGRQVVAKVRSGLALEERLLGITLDVTGCCDEGSIAGWRREELASAGLLLELLESVLQSFE